MLNSEELINKVKVYNKFLNPEKLNKAYNFAVKAHENQKRYSGDPYSIHPIAVANILTELKLDSATIATGLLHDTIEDTHATYETIKNEFGQEVADLVEGVTNVPLERTITEINSLVEALDEKNSAFQRLALLMGWRTWDVGASNEEMDQLRVDIKDRKKEEKKKAKDEEKERIRKQEEERKYLGKTESEIKIIKQRDSLTGTNKNSQNESLIKLGLTKKEIRELKLEKDRVNKIMELTNK